MIPYRYLSNRTGGRPRAQVARFQEATHSQRIGLAQERPSERLCVWLLHDCDEKILQEPKDTLPAVELALQIATRLGDEDLVSWTHTGFGRIYRLLSVPVLSKSHFEQGIRYARSGYQTAYAIRCRGLLSLSEDRTQEAKSYMLEALRAYTDDSSLVKINSDRGYTVVLESTGLAYLWHAYLHDEPSDLATAKKFFYEVLDTGSPQHSRRSRFAALNNLAAIPLYFDAPQDNDYLEQLRAGYDVLPQKSTLVGARIRWVLLRGRIATEGYSRTIRECLLTARKHILRHGARGLAAQLTLDIACHDLVHGHRRRAKALLKSSRDIFENAGLTSLAARLLESDALTAEDLEIALKATRRPFGAKPRRIRPPVQ